MKETAQPTPEIPYKAELLRKSLHLLALVIPAGMFYLGKYTSLLILVPFCMLAILLEIARVRSPAVANQIERLFGTMMRSKERSQTGAPVAINGATWVLLSATLLVFIFPVKVAAVSMIMFMVSDAAAALVGRKFGRFNWGTSPKTIEGSLAFLATAFLCLSVFSILPARESLLVAVIAMVLEITPIPLNDNLYVPLVSAGVIYSLLKFLNAAPLVLFF